MSRALCLSDAIRSETVRDHPRQSHLVNERDAPLYGALEKVFEQVERWREEGARVLELEDHAHAAKLAIVGGLIFHRFVLRRHLGNEPAGKNQ